MTLSLGIQHNSIVSHYAESRDYLNVMLSVFMLSVVRLSVVRLNVVMLSVVAPSLDKSYHSCTNLKKFVSNFVNITYETFFHLRVRSKESTLWRHFPA